MIVDFSKVESFRLSSSKDQLSDNVRCIFLSADLDDGSRLSMDLHIHHETKLEIRRPRD